MSHPPSRTAVRIAGALGLAHVVVTLAGCAISGPSQDTVLGAPRADLVRFYTEAHSAQLLTGGYIELLGWTRSSATVATADGSVSSQP